VVRQGSAKPFTPVQFRSWPPKQNTQAFARVFCLNSRASKGIGKFLPDIL